ncbi:MAG: Aerobic carbon monoxide dehydrogenase (quinone), small chain, partial [uncultured Nocardioidaceae bacterium]
DRAAARRTPLGQRCRAPGRGACAQVAQRRAAPRPPPDRDPRRLRARRVRVVHGAGRRSADALVPDAGRVRERLRDHHRRRARRRGRVARPGAAGVQGVPRAAVRVLHTGLPDHDHRWARGEPFADGGGGAGDDRREPLPVHGLPEHRRLGAAGGRAEGATAV